MPYYAGDYTEGDYTMGDNYAAGGLGSLLKKGLSFAMGAFGGPMGKIAAARLNLPPKPKVTPQPMIAPPTGPKPHFVPGVGVVSQRGAHHVFGKVVGKGAIERQSATTMIQGPDGVFRMHRGGRRMNVTNVHALRRAGRRVKGFLKLARRLGALPISPHGKKLFKAKRHKK